MKNPFFPKITACLIGLFLSAEFVVATELPFKAAGDNPTKADEEQRLKSQFATARTSEVKETNSLVDIGYHYVALKGSGQPDDADGDGTSDYLEDANGNAAVDSGETDWQSATDLGLKVLITRPKNNYIIP